MVLIASLLEKCQLWVGLGIEHLTVLKSGIFLVQVLIKIIEEDNDDQAMYEGWLAGL